MAERARLLAGRGRAPAPEAGRRAAVILEVGGQVHAIDLHHVLRMAEPAWSAMPRRPDCPASVRGVYGYVGLLYTVIDLSVLLGGAPMEHAGAMALMRPVAGLPVARIALLAGRTLGVEDVVDAPAAAPAHPVATHPVAALGDGRLVTVLDPARLFARPFGV
ncbi:chemotaxis protein CheW [Gluconacetobacter sacchari]|uniref:Chemotaxis protein CheW n=2 Tax=Gluconacetobacter sacchari TaxID=92759 RepID=A0A7W4IGP3_9PROT|nr:chemotaxis protein CheW [Gluconacetobacter sacchari]MBB2162377.1 chemotaxis protein CheW [Gluconacetobacter sacchari]